MTTVQAHDFTGFYVGILAGPESGSATIDPVSIPVKGNIAGVEVGANYQHESGLVIGLSADFERTVTYGSTINGKYMVYEGEGNTSAHVLAKLGYAFDRVMPYVIGGVAHTDTSATITCPAGAQGGVCKDLGAFSVSADEQRIGYSVGAGVEVAITDWLSFTTEYLYSDMGTEPMTMIFPAPDPIFEVPMTADVAMSASTLRTGLRLRF